MIVTENTLFAVAPDLLTAAKALVAAIEKWTESPEWGGPEMDDFTGPKLDALRAAIAKAVTA